MSVLFRDKSQVPRTVRQYVILFNKHFLADCLSLSDHAIPELSSRWQPTNARDTLAAGALNSRFSQ